MSMGMGNLRASIKRRMSEVVDEGFGFRFLTAAGTGCLYSGRWRGKWIWVLGLATKVLRFFNGRFMVLAWWRSGFAWAVAAIVSIKTGDCN